jgi:hypothetical protein
MTRPTVGSTTTWPTTFAQTNTYAIKAVANGGRCIINDCPNPSVNENGGISV